MDTASSLLYTARKSDRDGNKTKAEELYRRIITEFPESQEALSAKFDLIELNPTVVVELVEKNTGQKNHLLSDDEKIQAIKERTAIELGKRNCLVSTAELSKEKVDEEDKGDTRVFEREDYWPFAFGVFILAGLGVVPHIYSLFHSNTPFLMLLFFSLLSCGIFISAFSIYGHFSIENFLKIFVVIIIFSFASSEVTELSHKDIKQEETVSILNGIIVPLLLGYIAMAVGGGVSVSISRATGVSKLFQYKVKTNDSSKITQCSSCGNTVLIGDKVCHHCGDKFPYLKEPARTHVKEISAYVSFGYKPQKIADELNKSEYKPSNGDPAWSAKLVSKIIRDHIRKERK